MTEVSETIKNLLGLGLDPGDMNFIQISLRALVVFIAAIVITRTADKRFLARMTVFDVILGFILGSMLARAVNGSAPLLPTLIGAGALVLFHRMASFLARHSHTFGKLVKGHSEIVVQDGRVVEEAMRHNHLSEQDLLEELRLQGKVDSPEQVKRAVIERNGQISVVPRHQH